MRIYRCYSPAPLAGLDRLELTGAPAHHLARVLRVRIGTHVALFDDSGLEYPARVDLVSRDCVALDLKSPRDVRRESPLHTTVLQAVCGSDRMNYAIQKATEIGVTEIRPVWTARGRRAPPESRIRKRVDHWRSVAISASEQCGRTRLPVIHPPEALGPALAASAGATLRLVMSPGAHTPLTWPQRCTCACLLVGPEGGFEDTELKAAEAAGFAALSVGPRILRTETAGSVGLTLLQYRYGDLGSLSTRPPGPADS